MLYAPNSKWASALPHDAALVDYRARMDKGRMASSYWGPKDGRFFSATTCPGGALPRGPRGDHGVTIWRPYYAQVVTI